MDSGPVGERDYAAIALAYAKAAVADRRQKRHCKWVRFAAKRHLDDLKRAAKNPKDWPFRFDPWHANDACGFIELLPHVEGAWETETIRLEPAQIFILAVVFGWRHKDTGVRRFSTVYIEMARKGAKSTLTAGVSLYCLCCEGEVGPQVIIGATTGDQAWKVFGPAQKMVKRLPDLQQAFDLKAYARSIACEANAGYMQPINAKSSTQDGHNPHVGVLDELHAHKDRGLYDVIRSAFGSRKNPLLWIITTAGYNTVGVCYEQRAYLCKVLEGVFQADHYFGIIFTIDRAEDYGDGRKEGDDPYDERVWVKANPMLGVTPTIESMRSYATEAKASPASEGEFLTKRLNVWRNAGVAWLNMAQWAACAEPALDWADFEGLDCWIGGDLADKDDITGIVLIAYREDGQLIAKPMFWLPEAVLRSPDHAEGKGPAPYATWVKQGYLHLTPGDWVDHNVIEDQIRDWCETFAVRRIVFDQFAAAQQMAVNLNADLGDGTEPLAAVLHKKAANVTDPATDLEDRVKAGPHRFLHDGNPVMNWMASNAQVSRRKDKTILPVKDKPNSPNKIDGIDALINAMWPTSQPLEDEEDDPPFVMVV